jgi:hypothetical protein
VVPVTDVIRAEQRQDPTSLHFVGMTESRNYCAF